MHERDADPYAYHKAEAARLRAAAIEELFGRMGGGVWRALLSRPAAASDPRPAPPRPCPARAAW